MSHWRPNLLGKDFLPVGVGVHVLPRLLNLQARDVRVVGSSELEGREVITFALQGYSSWPQERQDLGGGRGDALQGRVRARTQRLLHRTDAEAGPQHHLEALKARLGKIGDANESRLEMRVPTTDGGHSTIFIAGWESRENFRGMKAHHITFDELDTMRDFFVGWQEIFRPALIDTGGSADFIGTPKKETPNLRRLEKEFAEKGAPFIVRKDGRYLFHRRFPASRLVQGARLERPLAEE